MLDSDNESLAGKTWKYDTVLFFFLNSFKLYPVLTCPITDDLHLIKVLVSIRYFLHNVISFPLAEFSEEVL